MVPRTSLGWSAVWAGNLASCPIIAFTSTLLLAGVADALGQAPTRAELAALCKERMPCSLVAAKPAGPDAHGRALTVIELNLGKKNPDNTSGNELFDCAPYRREFWLRVAGVAQPRRILTLCNDGYGTSGVGEDKIRMSANRLVHEQNGGSSRRWHVTRSIELSPMRLLATQECAYGIDLGYSVIRWDWQRLAGERRWVPRECPGEEMRHDIPPERCDFARATHRHGLIPRLDAVLPGGTHLGSCAAVFDESGRRGYVIHGRPRPRGAEFRVLMISERDLVVTLSDTAFASGAANWVDDDHIELWIGQNRTNLECPSEDKIKLSHWGIGLDGKVHHDGGGRAIPPEVVARAARKIAGRQQLTLHLRLPPAREFQRAITVAFSKTQEGKQVRLTATSPVRRGDETTLSSDFKVHPKAARCVVRDGQFDLIESGRMELLGE